MNDEAALADRSGSSITLSSSEDTGRGGQKPTAAELLATPGALLSRTHLRELGLERRAVDATFRACPIVAIPGYTRPLIRVADYLALIEQNTYRGDRVRP